AGFLAHRLALETAVPPLVICTSGPAHPPQHPAVLEAHHSRVPLIVQTADRPDELSGIRTNQTPLHTALYGVPTPHCL
ncbi:thiamine pyrophosphate-binding protein, partial [Cryobacterium sp. 10S3]|uniref:thiamine pyrophosphate-binding protein n=1 Tax=Cryobacterium sp. 10S3 TaxID=3048582 RepID=UPI002B23B59B